MSLERLKRFLRIDYDDDDEDILLMVDAAKEYIVDAVGFFEENSARMQLLLLNLVSTMYENRQYTVDKSNEKAAYAIRSIILQLQLGEGYNE